VDKNGWKYLKQGGHQDNGKTARILVDPGGKNVRMRALVTGGTGFVGGHVVRELLTHEFDVRVLVRPTSDRQHLSDLPVTFIPGDLSDSASFAPAVKDIDLLFHVAADYRFWVPRPEEMHQANVNGTIALIRAAMDAGIPRIVYTSSTVTVRCSENRLGTETDFLTPPECRSTYQLTKVLAEQAVRDFMQQGAPITIVNPSTPIGAGDHRPTPTGRLILDYLNRRLPAFLDTVLNWISVKDVARGHWLAATKGRVGERYILGRDNLSLGAFFQVLAEVSGIPAPRITIPYAVAYTAGLMGTAWGRLSGREPQATHEGVRMAGRPMQFDSTKAIQELGLPQTPIQVAAAEAVEWFTQHELRNRRRGTA
jgi:dihydroflavonol-4-reductase